MISHRILLVLDAKKERKERNRQLKSERDLYRAVNIVNNVNLSHKHCYAANYQRRVVVSDGHLSATFKFELL